MIKEQIMSELQSYITTYNIEYTVQLNDFTEVVIKTKYTNPSMIADQRIKMRSQELITTIQNAPT